MIRLIRNHLRLAAEDPHSWQGHQFDFTTVTFDGGDFSHAVFSGGTVNFFGAEFSGGKVNFSGARFSGGAVDLSSASGVPPTGLIPEHRGPLPAGVTLPPAWYPAEA